jgi:HD-GYP domain-containing protein (c-di-GMP phosphodiesterase class II)
MGEQNKPLENQELENSLLLRGAELGAVRSLLENCPVRELREGGSLFYAGQSNHFLYLLLSGRLRSHVKKDSRDTVEVLEPGEVVGALSVMNGQLTSATLVAHEDCRLLELEERVIWSLVENSHAVARNLLALLSRRMRLGHTVSRASLVARVSQQELEEFQLQQVEESNSPLAEGTEAEATRLYKTATTYVLESIRQTQERTTPDLEQGKELAEQIIDSMTNDSALLLLATDRRQEFAVSAHSVNVAILALHLAQTLNYDVENLTRVGVAALLHEIGVAWIPKGVLYETGKLNPHAQQRPVYSSKLLQEFYPQDDWLAETAGQIYERADGNGFPLGLQGGEIREEGAILGIVDVFEACIHDRSYRKALTGYQLLEELTRDDTKTFSDPIVKALVTSFSLYPHNEYVLLNTREIGQVVEVNRDKLSRPKIKILYDEQGRAVDEPTEMDLAHNPNVFITKAVTYHELP